MTRQELIERLRRQVYGGFPTDDAAITDLLVNSWMSDGIALAAKKNYTDNIQMEGVGFLNNSFYSTFKGVAVAKDENFVWKIILPEIPIGIGRNEGVTNLKFKNENGDVSLPGVPMSESQVSFNMTMRTIPNKILYYPEGGFIYAMSTILLNRYTATFTMVSGGDSTSLTSTLNVPGDYIPIIVEYVKAQLMIERAQPQDVSNDGSDIK